MQNSTSQNRPFSLVLSGGGALGAAHLGVLDRLEEEGRGPAEIIGTSMGAIVGALKAIGLGRSERVELFSAFSSRSKWLRPSVHRPALLDTQTLHGVFSQVFGRRSMADTTIALKVVATDFESGRQRVFGPADREVSLVDAVLCSMSIPGIFPPVELEGRLYVDGFITANLPVKEADSTLPVVAVDVMSHRILPDRASGQGALFKRPGELLETWERTLLLMVQHQTRSVLLAQKQGVELIEPHLPGFRLHQFDQWQAIRSAGYAAACHRSQTTVRPRTP